MKKVAVVFWSGTGNTESMADAVVQGSNGTKIAASDFGNEKMSEYDAVAFGCPAMGAEELEDTEFLPMFEAVKSELGGKDIALFGSYGWGDGEWMRIWEDDCKNAGANLKTESVICTDAPDDEALEKCRALGAALAE